MRERFILITNLDSVGVGPVRTFTHALLLVDGEGMPRQRQCKIRGFGTDAAWPTFDIFVESIEHELVDAQGNLFKIDDGGNLEALVTGAIMRLANGPELQLVTMDRERPLDMQTFVGEAGDGTYRKIWDILSAKVPEYWTRPNMPSLTWGPPSLRRAGGFF